MKAKEQNYGDADVVLTMVLLDDIDDLIKKRKSASNESIVAVFLEIARRNGRVTTAWFCAFAIMTAGNMARQAND